MTSGMRLAGLGEFTAEFPDARRLHLALARWNRRRLAVGRPSENWLRDLDEDQRMLRAEGAFVEAFRTHIAHLVEPVPTDPDGFLAWFEALKDEGPGQYDQLFPWLA